ncbi:MAG: type II toxin-antitoxin system RelE/ParE family toxin [Desulfomonilaceae bacterium]
MKRSKLIRPDAETDIAEAYRWYEEQREGLGADFLLCVEEGLSKIQRAPEAYPVVHKNVHRLLIKRFPYGIFYVVEPAVIIVLAVLHERRDPAAWQSRI